MPENEYLSVSESLRYYFTRIIPVRVADLYAAMSITLMFGYALGRGERGRS